MNKTLIILTAASLFLASCAKSVVSNTGEIAQKSFEAWVKVNGNGWKKTNLGSYVISSTEGTGAAVGDQTESPYVRLKYTMTDLSGNVSATTDAVVARKWGLHSNKYYFGPEIFTRADNSMYAGIDEILETMNVGGKCTFVIPGWLLTTNRYSTAQGYVTNYDGTTTSAIYEVEVIDAIDDISEWETTILDEYVAKHYPSAKKDTTNFYKVILKEAEAEFTNDTTIYVNYIGRLLSGEVFDTNIRDTANLHWRENFDKNTTFSHSQINWKTTESEITMTSSETSVITGFGHLLWTMGVHEKAIGIFHSDWGYGSDGSTDSSSGMTTIPGYAPLIFEVEVVDK